MAVDTQEHAAEPAVIATSPAVFGTRRHPPSASGSYRSICSQFVPTLRSTALRYEPSVAYIQRLQSSTQFEVCASPSPESTIVASGTEIFAGSFWMIVP